MQPRPKECPFNAGGDNFVDKERGVRYEDLGEVAQATMTLTVVGECLCAYAKLHWKKELNYVCAICGHRIKVSPLKPEDHPDTTYG